MSGKPCACGAPSVNFARYSGEHLCAAHFCQSVERRVRREMRKQGPFGKDPHFAVAISGGKDSVVALRLVHETFLDNPRVRVTAVTVDEGIEGYRPESIVVAAEHCKALGVPHEVVSYDASAGVTMDRVVANPLRMHAPCAYCGVLRRRNLNEVAMQVGATHLVTGHNLDDTAQSILMNHLKADYDRMARMAPHRPGSVQPGLIPRILPLRLIPEKEVTLYAILKGWHYHDGDCPYSTDATRGRYRDLLLSLEDAEPGTRHALVSGFDQISPLLARGPGVAACATCGEPASGAQCRACALLAEVGGRIGTRSS